MGENANSLDSTQQFSQQRVCILTMRKTREAGKHANWVLWSSYLVCLMLFFENENELYWPGMFTHTRNLLK